MKTFILCYMFFSTLIGTFLLLDPSAVALIIGIGNISVTLLLGLIGIFYVKNKVKAVDTKLDGKLEKLINATERASRAEGKEEGRKEEVASAKVLVETSMPAEVTIVENKDKEVIIKENRDK